MRTLTVTQINNYVKSLIENDIFLSGLNVEGEISNFKNHTSGHLYFRLKDEGAELDCVMFSSRANNLKFLPEDGMKVILTGRVSLYEKTGKYQFYADRMVPSGKGALYAAYEQLKNRLNEAGVFDEKYKKDLPEYPKTVAVITSPTGAAVKDVIRVISRRSPSTEIVVMPVLVQGESAAPDIVRGIEAVNRWGGADVIILGRGGGSIEDLWAFNEEMVARAIFRSRIPIITGIGHQTDTTIADFVADAFAPTPSAAAERAVRESKDTVVILNKLTKQLENAVASKISKYEYRYSLAVNKRGYESFERTLDEKSERLEYFVSAMRKTADAKLSKEEALLKSYADSLENRSPLRILGKGFALVYKGEERIKKSTQLEEGDLITVKFSDGDVGAEVRG
ncbi:MAG TPA: exodeoxyribonuclease VII large subunit [Lachnospiraceae bacterium]|nr:exodeoxyribonuclease VII large subunit [Lachnospiraceae bacterium]